MTFWCSNCGEPLEQEGRNLDCRSCRITWEGIPIDAIPLPRDQVYRAYPNSPYSPAAAQRDSVDTPDSHIPGHGDEVER